MPAFITPVDVTPSTFGVYTDVDVSAHVAGGATGAILRVKNSAFSDRGYGLRRNGGGGDLYHDLNAEGHNWEVAPLDDGGVFEARLQSADLSLELTGYTQGEADFPTGPVDVTPGSWFGGFRDVDISAHTGGDPAAAALLLFRPIATDVFARAKGASFDLNGFCDNRQPILCGVDGSEVLQARSGSSSQRLWLTGWFTSGVLVESVPVDVTPGSSATWTTHALPAGATGAVFWAVAPGSSPVLWGARKKGSGLSWVAGSNQAVSLAIVEADGNAEVEIWDDDPGDLKIYRLATFAAVDDFTVEPEAIESAGEVTAVEVDAGDDFAVTPEAIESAGEVTAVEVGGFGRDTADPVIALVALPYDPSIEVTLEGPPAPFGAVAFGETDFSSFGAETQVYASDVGYDSRAGDSPAATPFPSDLLQTASFELRAFGGDRPGGESGREVTGALKLANPDGAYDAAALLGWDNRPVEIWRGTRARAFADFNLVLRGQALRVGFDEQSLTIALRDRQTALDQPVNAALYDGSGGLAGHEGIAGLAKPVAWGNLTGDNGNVPAVEIDPVNLVYQVHDGAIEAIDAVRDKGIALTAGSDRADYAALLAGTPPSGGYDTCLALGLLRLNPESGSPAGAITVDLQGNNSGGYVETTAEIARRVVATRLGAGNLSEGEIDELAVAALALAQPAPVGYWVGTAQVTAREVLDNLLGAIGGWHAFTREGKFTVARLDLTGTPAETLTVSDMALRQPPERAEVAPVWQVRMGWGVSWLVQSADDLASEAPDKARYGNARRYAPASDSTIRARHRGARSLTVEAYFAFESDAQAEAARLLALYGPDRDIWTFGRLGGLRGRWAGDTVTLNINGRYGHPKTCQVIGLREELSRNEGGLVLWG